MAEVQSGTYTAKLTDGPLEGTTIRTEFLDSGEPRPRIDIPAGTGTKHYFYSRGGGVEYSPGDDEHDSRPTAVEYRFAEVTFG